MSLLEVLLECVVDRLLHLFNRYAREPFRFSISAWKADSTSQWYFFQLLVDTVFHVEHVLICRHWKILVERHERVGRPKHLTVSQCVQNSE